MAVETTQSQHWSQSCTDALRTTTECADWCIQNDPSQYADCIRRCLDAGTLAGAAASLVWREGPHARQALAAAGKALEDCAAMCDKHRGVHDVLERCATTCRVAAEACLHVAQQQK